MIKLMRRNGFALFEIVIVLSVIALLAGGGLYFNNLQNQKSTMQVGNDAVQKAKDLQKQSQAQANQEQNVINQLNQNRTSTPVVVATSTRKPAELKPYKTDSQKVEYMGYNGKTSRSVPIDYYTYKNNDFRIEYVPTGENMAGTPTFDVSIEIFRQASSSYESVGGFTVDERPVLEGVYTHNDDIILLSSRLYHYSCCDKDHEERLTVYNPILNKINSKNVAYVENGYQFSVPKSFSLFLQDNKLYANSANEYAYFPDAVKNIYSLAPVDGFGTSAYYFLNNGEIQNVSSDFKDDYLREAARFNSMLSTDSQKLRLPLGQSFGGIGIDVPAAPDSLILGVSSSTDVLMADGTSKNIKNIIVGDKVMSYDFGLNATTSAVVIAIVSRISDTLTLNNAATVGYNHLIPIQKQVNGGKIDIFYRWANDLLGGAVMTTNGFVPTRITSGFNKNETVYNISLDPPHGNFYANNYVVMSEPPYIDDWFAPLVGRTLNLLAAGETQIALDEFNQEFSWRLKRAETPDWDKKLPSSDSIQKDIQALFASSTLRATP